MHPRQHGFTLVELIVVIVILGILAAVALPRFVNVQSEARVAAVQGIAGGLRAAAALASAKYYAMGTSPTAVSTTDGTTVQLTGAFPKGDSTGIGAMMQCESATKCTGNDWSAAAGVATFQPPGGSATCQVTYTDTTGAVATTTSNCN